MKHGLRINLGESGRSKMRSGTESHKERQSLLADAVSTKEFTIDEPIENKMMKAGGEDSWYLDPHFQTWSDLQDL